MAKIEKEKFHILEFVKKSEYTGSMEGMRYMIARAGEDEMEAVIWPEPRSYGATEEDLKIRKRFPLTKEGVEAVADYLNEQYEALSDLWKNAI